MRLAEDTGAVLKVWRVQPSPPFSSSINDLKALLTPRFGLTYADSASTVQVHPSRCLDAKLTSGVQRRGISNCCCPVSFRAPSWQGS